MSVLLKSQLKTYICHFVDCSVSMYFILFCSVLPLLETLKGCTGLFQLSWMVVHGGAGAECLIRGGGWSRTENRSLEQRLCLIATALPLPC